MLVDGLCGALCLTLTRRIDLQSTRHVSLLYPLSAILFGQRVLRLRDVWVPDGDRSVAVFAGAGLRVRSGLK